MSAEPVVLLVKRRRARRVGPDSSDQPSPVGAGPSDNATRIALAAIPAVVDLVRIGATLVGGVLSVGMVVYAIRTGMPPEHVGSLAGLVGAATGGLAFFRARRPRPTQTAMPALAALPHRR